MTVLVYLIERGVPREVLWPIRVKAERLVSVPQPLGRVGAHLPTWPEGRVWHPSSPLLGRVRAC